ncbi:hypothetical protein [Nostoc sp.]|uniref:hypothetical protein n=1 Tax=Nostoc sp. TaxID=1180 RepID=UPI002FF6C570
MSGTPGKWTVEVHYSPSRFPPDTESIAGYSDDNPYFSLTSGGTQWSLISAADGRVMYANWIGSNTATPVIDSKLFTADAVFYDCLNGKCVLKTQYNTPGIYNSLADCQAVCASGGACGEGRQCVDPTTFIPSGKVCLDKGEFESIEALISRIGSEVC